MANEITISASLTYINAAAGITQAKSLSLGSTTFNITGKKYVEQIQSIPTTAGGTALSLGALTGATLGWFFIRNTDATNYVQIMNATSGTVLLRLAPGECAMGRFDAGVTAPAALANTAAVVIEYLILEN